MLVNVFHMVTIKCDQRIGIYTLKKKKKKKKTQIGIGVKYVYEAHCYLQSQKKHTTNENS